MLDHSEDVALNFGADETTTKKIRYRHPYAALCHILFRLLAVILYFIINLFTNSFITQFIVIVLLLSVDFWVVKNVTGRLLVGLRWWNYIDEDGNSQWVFESRKKQKGVKSSTLPNESRIFWLGLISFPIIWVFLFIVALVSFKPTSMLIVTVSITLTSANMIGYIKCKKDAGKDVQKMAGSFLGRQLLNQMIGKKEEQTTNDSN